MKLNYWTVEVLSDIRSFGTTEDGRDFEGEVYLVQVEDVRGRRLRHDARFPGCVREVDPEGWDVHFSETRVDAQAKAEVLAKRIATALHAGVELNDAHWCEAPAAYGSAFYRSNDGEGELMCWEKRAEEDAKAWG